MPSIEQQAKRRQRQILAEIAKLGLCLPGSLVTRTTRCGTPTCRCASDPAQRHGPYPTWFRKIGAKTVTRTLSPYVGDDSDTASDNATSPKLNILRGLQRRHLKTGLR